jgi:hypothetical protein
MISENGSPLDGVSVDVGSGLNEKMSWKAAWKAEFYDGEFLAEEIDKGFAGAPSRVEHIDGNLLVTAGITALLNLLIGAGGTAFNNANSYLGVGDSTTAAAIGQTDLQAATNKMRKAMDATYPQVASNVVTFRSTFATGDANYSLQEVACFNAAAAGTMLNRKVQDLGTKTSASTLVLTLTITLS